MYHVIVSLWGGSDCYSDLKANKRRDYLNHFSRNRFGMNIEQNEIW